MGLSDSFKDLRKKAEEKAAEHKGQIIETVQKAEQAADQRTGGKYHDKIQKAGAKAQAAVEGLPDPAEAAQPPTGVKPTAGEEPPRPV